MKESNNPLISVVMPAYNAEKYIDTAIQSILDQTYTNFELIVINDCSTDTTREIIKKYAKKDKRVIHIDNKENLKIAKTLNKGIDVAKGKYIVRMDSDDYSYPDRIEKQVRYMENNPQIVLSSGNMDICDENLNKKRTTSFPETNKQIKDSILQFNPLVSPSMIWKRETSLDIGGFSTSTISEDYMFVMDMSSRGELGNLKDSLIKYRVLSTSMMGTKMKKAHLSTIQIALTGHLKYDYPMTFKTELYLFLRFLIAYFIPAPVWRYISSIIGK